SPDSKLLALGDGPGVVRLVVVDTGKEIARLTSPEQVRHVPCCFTPNGAQLVTIGLDNQTLHFFDLRAIRVQLAELGLDWDAPPLAAAAPAAREPLPVEIVGDNVRPRSPADDLFSRAHQHIRQKEHEKALTALREAIRADPRHTLAYNSLAWWLLVGPEKLRNAEEALRLARKAVELAPGQFMFHNTLGVALYRTGRFAQAIPVLERSRKASHG